MVEREKLHMRLTVIWWSFLFIAFMCLMLFTASRKAIVIADGSYGRGVPQDGDKSSERERQMELTATQENTGIFLIPLEKGVKAESVVVENCYMDRELHLFIEGAKEEFYENCSVGGDVVSIRSAGWEKQRRGVLLIFHMDDVYEYRTSMDAEMLRIEVCDPHELYRMLVVVDPAGDGGTGDESWEDAAEAQITLGVCRLLHGQLNNENIRVYFTRTEDEGVSAEKKLEFVEALQPDLFLHIGVTFEEDASQYGIRGRYNESYFIPRFGNVEFADIVTRNVTVACGNRAVGLNPAEEDDVLWDVRIPAAGVDLGNLTNEKERGLLYQEGYREKLAQGIAGALREVYTEYYE